MEGSCKHGIELSGSINCWEVNNFQCSSSVPDKIKSCVVVSWI
jgi:hypothetical protein